MKLLLVVALFARGGMGREECVQDHFGRCVDPEDALKIRQFNERMNRGDFNNLSYAQLRRRMTEEGLRGSKVHVGHIRPDLGKKNKRDPGDYGFNLMAQPAGENMALGRNEVTCEMAVRWCRVPDWCDGSENS